MKTLAKYILFGAATILWLPQNAMSQNKPTTNPDFLIINQNDERHEATIYPNPAKEKIVKIKSSILIKSVEIMTMIGKCVLKEYNNHMIYDDITLDLEKCNRGTYYAKITFEDDKSVIKKLILK